LEAQSLILAGAALLVVFLSSWLRQALLRANPARVLEGLRGSDERARLSQLLERAPRLALTAGLVELAGALTVVLALQQGLGAPLLSGLVALAGLILFGQLLPQALSVRLGDPLLTRTLWSFSLIQWPLLPLSASVEWLQRALLRVAGRDVDPAEAHGIVEDLREVVEETEITGQLDETEKEIIGNVMEAREVTVAAIMTPRTEIRAVERSEGLAGAARLSAECGHSRVPVYEENLDRIVGTIAARDVLAVAVAEGLEQAELSAILRPVLFVPETKRVADLLEEFKREKQKLAVVLDEYGGTAGMVTLGDVVAHLVGDLRDEFAEREAPRVRALSDGSSEIDASLRVAEANERLELSIPEDEHYETMAGFLLSELGHFPRVGETLQAHGCEFRVLEATERRIVRLRVARKAS
jgi:CBS domain containing-hemolysin-like protein